MILLLNTTLAIFVMPSKSYNQMYCVIQFINLLFSGHILLPILAVVLCYILLYLVLNILLHIYCYIFFSCFTLDHLPILYAQLYVHIDYHISICCTIYLYVSLFVITNYRQRYCPSYGADLS